VTEISQQLTDYYQPFGKRNRPPENFPKITQIAKPKNLFAWFSRPPRKTQVPVVGVAHIFFGRINNL